MGVSRRREERPQVYVRWYQIPNLSPLYDLRNVYTRLPLGLFGCFFLLFPYFTRPLFTLLTIY